MRILHCQVEIRKIYKDPKCAKPMDVNMGSLGKSDDVGVTLHLGWSHQNLSPHPTLSVVDQIDHEDHCTRLYSLDFGESLHLFIYSSQLNLRLGFLLLMPKSLCLQVMSSFLVGWFNFSISQRCTLPLCNAKIKLITSLKLTVRPWEAMIAKPRGHRTGEVF